MEEGTFFAAERILKKRLFSSLPKSKIGEDICAPPDLGIKHCTVAGLTPRLMFEFLTMEWKTTG